MCRDASGIAITLSCLSLPHAKDLTIDAHLYELSSVLTGIHRLDRLHLVIESFDFDEETFDFSASSTDTLHDLLFGASRLDKGVNTLLGKSGHAQKPATVEKISDGIRSGFKKLTGKDVPIKDQEYR
ncbi:hypothetical protein JCM10295v2_001868 [Rhodotorula toruloides]